MNKELYNQKDMDTYMNFKNNIYHNTFFGEIWLKWSFYNNSIKYLIIWLSLWKFIHTIYAISIWIDKSQLLNQNNINFIKNYKI